jgi:hypothetical protein
MEDGVGCMLLGGRINFLVGDRNRFILLADDSISGRTHSGVSINEDTIFFFSPVDSCRWSCAYFAVKALIEGKG